MTSSKTQIERLAILETQLDNIQDDINTIKNNHLPHIYSKLEELQTFRIQVLTLAGVGGMIGSAFIQILLKFIN